MSVMTREEFAERWDSDENGGGITFEDVADCAKHWGLYQYPKTHDINKVLEDVVSHSGAKDGAVNE